VENGFLRGGDAYCAVRLASCAEPFADPFAFLLELGKRPDLDAADVLAGSSSETS